MKKLFLLASMAFVIASCSKNDNSTPAPVPQPPTPETVPAGFVKTIKEYLGEETEAALQKTTTYKVENNLLKGWEVLLSNGKKIINTLTYEGAHLKTFTIEDQSANVTNVYTFSYQNNKLDKITRKRGDDQNMTDTYQITLDNQGRIVKKAHIGNDGWDGGEWEVTFTYTDNLLVVQKGGESVKYKYTYTGENVTKVDKEPSLGVPYVLEYDTAIVNDLNNQYIYLTNIAQLFNRWGIDSLANDVNDPFVINSKNIVKKYLFYTYDIQKNEQNRPTKITQKDNGGNPMTIKVYSY